MTLIWIVTTDVLDLTTLKDTPKAKIQAARLRTAVEMARAELGQAILTGHRSNTAIDDWDSPLDPAIRNDLEAAFKAKYHFTLPDTVKPAPQLFARLYREFKRGCLSIHDLQKVKAASDAAVDVHATKKQKTQIFRASWQCSVALLWCASRSSVFPEALLEARGRGFRKPGLRF